MTAREERLLSEAVCVGRDLLKLLAMGEEEEGGWENCSLLLRCCFRFCWTTRDTLPLLLFLFFKFNYGITAPTATERSTARKHAGLTSVLTSRTDLKSLDMDASLDCEHRSKAI